MKMEGEERAEEMKRKRQQLGLGNEEPEVPVVVRVKKTITADEPPPAIMGGELERLSDSELEEVIGRQEKKLKLLGDTLPDKGAKIRFRIKKLEDEKAKRIAEAKEAKTPELINLEDDAGVPKSAGLEMPIGRKTAKEVIEKEKFKKQVGENEYDSSNVHLELEELSARRLESERKSAEQS